jgi:hypothetical protein
MKLSISKLLIACSFSFLACDTNVAEPTQPTVESPAVSAVMALGPDRRITLTTLEEAKALIERAVDSADATGALRRQRTLGFHFDRRATSAFWTVGKDGEKLGTVLQRGVREDEQVLVATVLRPDLTIVSTLEVEGEGEAFTVYEIAEGCMAEEIPVESTEVTVTEETEEGDDVVVIDAALIAYTGGTSTQCTLQNGIIDAGGQIADGLCTGEANFVCFWTYMGNDAGYNRCVRERKAACGIGTDKWNKPTCN